MADIKILAYQREINKKCKKNTKEKKQKTYQDVLSRCEVPITQATSGIGKGYESP